MKTASRVAFWIAVLGLLLYAVIASLQLLGVRVDESDFLLMSVFVLGPMYFWYFIFNFNPSQGSFFWFLLSFLIVVIDVLALAYLISGIKEKILKQTEGRQWEFVAAKILIVVLALAMVGSVLLTYILDPYGLRRVLTVSQTTGEAPLTVQITGPAELLSLQDATYTTYHTTNYTGTVSSDNKETCGFYIAWAKIGDSNWVSKSENKGSRVIFADEAWVIEETPCKSPLTYTFTEPGQYRVRASVPNLGKGWTSEWVEISVE